MIFAVFDVLVLIIYICCFIDNVLLINFGAADK